MGIHAIHQKAFISYFFILSVTERYNSHNPLFALFQGVVLNYVTANDADEDGNAKLVFTITHVEPEKGGELFSIQDYIQPNRVSITVTKNLRGYWGSYRLTIMVSRGFKLNVCTRLIFY